MTQAGLGRVAAGLEAATRKRLKSSRRAATCKLAHIGPKSWRIGKAENARVWRQGCHPIFKNPRVSPAAFQNILRGYDIHCKNAFWSRDRQAYVDMNWRLFGAVFYFKPAPHDLEQLPFGFIEVSPTLQQVARTRGFFTLGFESRLFHDLKPLEQRLAVYLAKKFTSQSIHKRYADELAKALPIDAARPRDNVALLKKTAQGILEKNVPILSSFALEKGRNGQLLAVFHRRSGSTPTRLFQQHGTARCSTHPGILYWIDQSAGLGGKEDG
jgi:hypothetical protein